MHKFVVDKTSNEEDLYDLENDMHYGKHVMNIYDYPC